VSEDLIQELINFVRQTGPVTATADAALNRQTCEP
jgi:hypothetical protein